MTGAAVAGGGGRNAAWRHVGKPVFDAMLLVFGVVLGFALNEWAQGRAQRERAVPPERIYYGQMFGPANLLGTAWTSARESRATDEMPYDLVLSLARVYDRQERYRTLSDALLGDVYGDIVRRGGVPVLRDGFANFDLIARDFADRERDLALAYDSALVRVRGARLH